MIVRLLDRVERKCLRRSLWTAIGSAFMCGLAASMAAVDFAHGSWLFAALNLAALAGFGWHAASLARGTFDDLGLRED